MLQAECQSNHALPLMISTQYAAVRLNHKVKASIEILYLQGLANVSAVSRKRSLHVNASKYMELCLLNLKLAKGTIGLWSHQLTSIVIRWPTETESRTPWPRPPSKTASMFRCGQTNDDLWGCSGKAVSEVLSYRWSMTTVGPARPIQLFERMH